MAIIQDLPLELLYRILDIAFDYPFDPKKCSLLSRTALVAHSWTKPSVQLLYASPSLERNRPACRAQLRHLEKQEEGAVVEQALLLLPALETTTRFVDCTRKLRRLHLVHEEAMNVQLFDSQMFANLEILILQCKLTGSFVTDQHFPFLTRLEFTLGQLFSTLLESLVDKSPRLYYLQLTWSTSWSIDVEISSPILLALAPELRHFGFVFEGAGSDYSSASADLRRFLRECPKLRSLELKGIPSWELDDIIGALESQPVLLTTSNLWTESDDHSMYRSFLAALSCTALVCLRRWRHFNYATKMSALKEAKPEWEAACAERGIEVRDLRRRFTD